MRIKQQTTRLRNVHFFSAKFPPVSLGLPSGCPFDRLQRVPSLRHGAFDDRASETPSPFGADPCTLATAAPAKGIPLAMVAMFAGATRKARIGKLHCFLARLVRGCPEQLPTPRLQLGRRLHFGASVGIAPDFQTRIMLLSGRRLSLSVRRFIKPRTPAHDRRSAYNRFKKFSLASRLPLPPGACRPRSSDRRPSCRP